MHRYVIQIKGGLKYFPEDLKEMENLVKRGWVRSNTMVLTQSLYYWWPATSYTEICALLRRYNPSQDSILNQLRSFSSSHSRDNAYTAMALERISSIRRKKHPFWKRLFSH